MRLAGEACKCDPDVFQTIWKHLRSDGMPDQAANQLAAEMMVHGSDIDTSVENYERYYKNYREKGFCEEAAQAMAVEAMEGREEPPSENLRFARIYGDEFKADEDMSGRQIADIAEQMSGNKPEEVYMKGQRIY